MVIKSAHIDATLRVAGLSELFTQDIEDMIGDKAGKEEVPAGNGNGNHPAPPPQAQPVQTPPPQPREPATDGQNHTGNGRSYESNRITAKQFSFIMDLLKDARMTKTELNQHCVEAHLAPFPEDWLQKDENKPDTW
jgi:hypothetical protein